VKVLVWVDMTAGAGLIMLDINGISTPSMSSTVFFAVLVIFASMEGLKKGRIDTKETNPVPMSVVGEKTVSTEGVCWLNRSKVRQTAVKC